MQLTILQEELSWAIAIVSKVATNRGQLPVLANILIEADKEGVSLSGTNLEIGLRVSVGGKVITPGKITVPAKSWGEFVAAIPAGPVELMEKESKLSVKSGKFAADFAGISATEFPIVPKAGESKSGKIRIHKSVIAEIATQVAYAAANDESRPVLTGIKFNVNNDQLLVTATDGFRLSKKTLKNDAGGSIENIILPARTIMELARIAEMGKTEGVEMEVIKENNQVIFTYDKVEVISRILEGNFPDVDKIIPSEFKTEVRIDKDELTRAVRAAGIFARENNNIIKFKVQDSNVKVYAVAQQSGESEVNIDADIKGEEGEIAFNYRYVMDYLGSLGEERIVLKMSGNLAPGVWMGEKDEKLIHLIMPVRI